MQITLICPILCGRLKKGVRDIVPSHKQKTKGAGTTVAGNGGGRFLQVNPFKRTVLLHQILNVLQPFLVHSRVGDEQNPPVDVPGIL